MEYVANDSSLAGEEGEEFPEPNATVSEDAQTVQEAEEEIQEPEAAASDAETSSSSEEDEESQVSSRIVDTAAGDEQSASTSGAQQGSRKKQKPGWMTSGDFVCVADAESTPTEDPQTFEAAMSSAEKDQWMAAMQSELGSLSENKTWSLVPRPVGGKVIGNRWVLRKKEQVGGKIRFKARLCAKSTRRNWNGVKRIFRYLPSVRKRKA